MLCHILTMKIANWKLNKIKKERRRYTNKCSLVIHDMYNTHQSELFADQGCCLRGGVC
jgi:hypothetical protein